MADQKTPLRFGIIGFGSFAERAIAPAIRATPGAALMAVQKRSLDAARALAKAGGIPLAFATAEELVAHPDVDAVFIVSANAAHRAETIAAARQGKHVLVEKPMALNVREAEEMIAECARHNVRLMVGHMIRFSPLAQRMRDVVRSGRLGKLVSARADFIYDGRLSQRRWLRDRDVAGGGPVFDVGVHCLDTLRFVLDDEWRPSSCWADRITTNERVPLACGSAADNRFKFSARTLPVRRKKTKSWHGWRNTRMITVAHSRP